jgi:cytochrome c oxidase subunit II
MDWKYLPIFPESASNFAPHVDALYAYLVSVSAFFSIMIAIVIVAFAVKYRRKSDSEIPPPLNEHGAGGMILEITWSVIPFLLSLVMFGWGAVIFFDQSKPPADAMDIWVTGKQWMWKIQHLEGAREINELHVPINRNIRLTLTSEDVIHDFFVPAFRTKTDVVPGRYTTEWFRPTKVGQYHLFCAEYCGTKHSGMVGTVYVMNANDYDAWLTSGLGVGSMSQKGDALFQQLGCATCHVNDGTGRSPSLRGLYGTKVELRGGGTAVADASYIRESIVNPQAKVVNGYESIMPTFQGLVTEDQIQQLIEYLKSLGPTSGAAAGGDQNASPVSRNPNAGPVQAPAESTTSAGPKGGAPKKTKGVPQQ